MIPIFRNDAALVKIYKLSENEDEKLVASYYTTAINETIKSFITLRNNEVECIFNKYDSSIDEEYTNGFTYYIEDVNYSFATGESITVIEVYIR